MKLRLFLSRAILPLLVVFPLSLIVILTIIVLLPSLKDPENNIYGSAIGYPAIKRMLGQPIKVQTVEVVSRAEGDRIAAAGEAVALEEVRIRPQVGGKVKYVYVAEGDKVRRGQPLLQIDSKSFEDRVTQNRNNVLSSELDIKVIPIQKQQNLELLKANLQNSKEQLIISKRKLEQRQELAISGADTELQVLNAKQEYLTQYNLYVAAQKELDTEKISAPKDIQAQKLTLDNRRISLNQSYRDLDSTVLYASNDGLVSQVSIARGEIANPVSAVMIISKGIVFKAYIDQARIASVKIGDRATVRLVSYPGQTFQGKVIRLNPTVVTTTSRLNRGGIEKIYTYSVWIALEDIQMTPGLQGFAQFSQEKISLIIPESSLTHLSAGEGMVMVAEGEQAAIRKVKIGKKYDNQREVISGLNRGELVVLNPRSLNPSDRIKIQVASDQK